MKWPCFRRDEGGPPRNRLIGADDKLPQAAADRKALVVNVAEFVKGIRAISLRFSVA
jgi:hypothetical protein